jgi:hypothetical protein
MCNNRTGKVYSSDYAEVLEVFFTISTIHKHARAHASTHAHTRAHTHTHIASRYLLIRKKNKGE